MDDCLEAKCSRSLCVIYQGQQQQQQQQQYSGLKDESPSPKFALTYQSAIKVSQKHEEILQTRIQEHNVEKQQDVVVAILAHNSIDLLLVVLACTRLKHALPVLLNTRWTYQEMAQALQSQNLNDRTIFLYDDDDSHAHRVRQAAALLRDNHQNVSMLRLSMLSVSHRTMMPSASPTARGKDDTNNPHPMLSCNNNHDNTKSALDCCDSTATALILFTSGTTSGSKGVLLSHRALYVQAMAKLQSPCGYNHQTRMLATTVPFFHVGGLSSALAVLLAGGALVFPPPGSDITLSRGFQPGQVLQSLQQGPRLSSNTLVVVPAMLSALAEHISVQKESQAETNFFPSVRLVLIGGQSASSLLLQQIYVLFPNARVVQTYACTEGTSSLTFWDRTIPPSSDEKIDHPNNLPAVGDCVGLPPSHVELRLSPTINTDDNNDKSDGGNSARGIIATRGPHILTGYWRRGGSDGGRNNGTKSSIYSFDAPLTPDGWFVTNDIGYRDAQGRYYFCGRVADVIRTGGETVLAPEVERVLSQHDQIQECAVFALPDYKYGETVCAAIVVRGVFTSSSSSFKSSDDKTKRPSLEDLRNYCAQQGLAGYKRPRRLFVVTELPRNSSGKLLKRLLVDRFGGGSNSTTTRMIEGRSTRSKL